MSSVTSDDEPVQVARRVRHVPQERPVGREDDCRLTAGQVVTRLGTNTEPGVGGNQLKPEQWRTGFFGSPHGVAVDARGDLFVSEFNVFVRAHRFNRQ